MGPSRAQATMNSWHRNGEMTPAHFLSSHVGSGSDAHCLSSSALTDDTTSAGMTAENSRNTQPTGAGVKDGGSASAVAARTPATLLSKKLCRSDALISVDGGTRPRPSSLSKDRHRRHGCDCSASTRVDHYFHRRPK